MRIFSYHCVRNEGKNMRKIIECLQNQTIPIERIIIINDGSEDRTSEIVRGMGIEVIDLPNENKDRRECSDFAKLPNTALGKIDKEYDFIFNSGGDHILPPNYLKVITAEMVKNKRLGICSGYIKDEPSDVPRGSGRVTRFDIFRSLDFKIPLRFGYESYLLFKSNQLGFENKIIDIETKVLRSTTKNYSKGLAKAYGRSYRALGYNPIFVLRNLMQRRKSLSNIVYQLVGYMDNGTELYDKDIRQFIADTHRQLFKNKIRGIIRV